VLILLSAWFVAAAFLWIETSDGPADIVEAIRLGAPAWMLAVPLIGLVSLAVLAQAKPGAYWLLFLLGIVQIVAAMAVFDLQAWGLRAFWGAALSIPAAFIFALVALAMAFGDAPPLDSPIARLVYLGRRKHLLDMQRLAERWGWQARGPEPRNLALRITGEWAGRELHLESGAVYRFSSSAASYYYLSVAVRSKKNLLPMALAIGMEGPKASQRKTAAKRKLRDAKGRTKTFYIWPPAGRPAGEVDAAALIAALESGKEFLRSRTSVNAAGESVWFGRQASFTMSETAEDVEAIIRWLDAIAGVMEKHHADGEAIRE
jgi:hypothetical protein